MGGVDGIASARQKAELGQAADERMHHRQVFVFGLNFFGQKWLKIEFLIWLFPCIGL